MLGWEVTEKQCTEHPRRPDSSTLTYKSKVSRSWLRQEACPWWETPSTHPSLLPRLVSRHGVMALRSPRLRATYFLGGILEPLPLHFFRFWSSAWESSFGEIPALGWPIWGGEEVAGPCHLYRNGSQPLRLVRSQHCRQIPGQKWPPVDAAYGPQGIYHISWPPVLLLLSNCIFKCCH